MLFDNCSETALKQHRNCSRIAVKVLRNCSETAVNALGPDGGHAGRRIFENGSEPFQSGAEQSGGEREGGLRKGTIDKSRSLPVGQDAHPQPEGAGERFHWRQRLERRQRGSPVHGEGDRSDTPLT